MSVDTTSRMAWDEAIESREPNSKSVWDKLWHRETDGGQYESWRTYPEQYARIRWLLKYSLAVTQPPAAPTIVDLGCGEGVLLSRIRADLETQVPGAQYVGRDISEVAAGIARGKGLDVQQVDLEDAAPLDLPTGDVLLGTEVLEHLTMPTVERILEYSKGFNKAFFMVPNYCLGPEHESQHLRKWSAKEFLDLLRSYWGTACRVEVFYDPDVFAKHGHRGYLLGICGYQKRTTLSMTMPVKDEASGVERVLASFRGAADEIVIAIDDLTTDATEEICARYADKVFKYTWQNDFSAARNICIKACTGDWIFMTEGHEHLHRGTQWLLQLDETPEYIDVLSVRRESRTNLWYFPWLFRRRVGPDGEPVIRFQNACHNALTGYEDKRSGQAPQISTWHERAIERAEIRRQQRNSINKQEYLRRIRVEHNIRDMYYLASEYRDERCPTCEGRARVMVEAELKPCPDCIYTETGRRPIATGIRPFALRQSLLWFDRFIAVAPRTPMCYQARLALAATWKRLGQPAKSADILLAATGDDPTRIEHWYMLGQLYEEQDRLDLALRYYEYASHGIDRPPVSGLFIEKTMYTYAPALALARTYANFGLLEEGLTWALRVPDLLPEWCAPDLRENALQLIAAIEEAKARKEVDPHGIPEGMFL